MKILVVYYSRTGNTKAIAEALVEALNADIDEIIDLKKRMGFLNWLRSGHDALRKKFTQIKTQKMHQIFHIYETAMFLARWICPIFVFSIWLMELSYLVFSY